MKNGSSSSSDRAHHRTWQSLARVWLWVALSTSLLAAPDYSIPYAFNTFAGTASIGSGDGAGGSARFNGPYAVAADTAGNLFVADNWNRTIRKITPTGVVTTLAGTPGSYGAGDGPGNIALFGNPWGIAVDAAGNVYVADAFFNTIRKITPTGFVSTLAGAPFLSGSTDGIGSAALFNVPSGMAVDTAGNVYVTDSGNSTIRKIKLRPGFMRRRNDDERPGRMLEPADCGRSALNARGRIRSARPTLDSSTHRFRCIPVFAQLIEADAGRFPRPMPGAKRLVP